MQEPRLRRGLDSTMQKKLPLRNAVRKEKLQRIVETELNQSLLY